MAKGIRYYSQDEDDVIRAGVRENMPVAELARRLGRTTDSVGSRTFKLRLVRSQQAVSEPRLRTVARDTLHGDARFIRAMLNAIRSGNEHRVIGVVKGGRGPAPLLRHVSQSPGIRSNAAFD